jgi:MraZ protein
MNLNSDFCFFGTFAHTLDDKGRLALPSDFREELSRSERPDTVMALAGGDFLTLYPEEQLRKLMAGIMEGAPDTASRNAALRALSKGSRKLNLDKVGRILISPELRAAAGLTREVSVIGVGSKIQIWDAAGHGRQESQDKAVLSEILANGNLDF